MSSVRLFLDTSYVIALLNSKDQHHQKAKSLYPHARYATEVWTTEAILVEIGDSLSRKDRRKAAGIVHFCYQTSNIQIVNVSTDILQEALLTYVTHEDKTWGLTDCISFIVMRDNNLTDALTA